MEATSSVSQSILDGFLAVVGNSDWVLNDGSSAASQPWVSDAETKIGLVFTGTEMAINMNGTWSVDTLYSGVMLQGALDLFRGGSGVGKMRNLLRYDIASYQDGKDIIDGLMAGDS